MIKLFNVELQIGFDVDNDEIVSVKILKQSKSEAAPKKATTPKVKIEDDSEPTVMLGENILQLSPKAVELLGVEPGDRISVNYEQRDKLTWPVIGKSSEFGSAAAGNKLTKSLTVSCRGKQRESLSAYGTKFTCIPDRSGIFALVGDEAENLQNPLEKADISKVVDIPEAVTDVKFETAMGELDTEIIGEDISNLDVSNLTFE